MDDVRRRVLREDFAGLEQIADAVRSSKARFPGGGWKLFRFYEALNRVPAGETATDADWQRHIAFFQRWTSAWPQSITARVGLAGAYVEYAWAARGNGYSNTVTDQGWQLFSERTKQAERVLLDAEALPVKCPHWYAVLQRIAMAEGADKDQLRAIFEKAIKFEPDYFVYYQYHAMALLPKWTGEPGDTEAFAVESYRRIGGKKGAYIYFEIASNLCGACGDFSPNGYSWSKIQEGFAALEELYGLSELKMNRFAYLAATYGDKPVAAKAFFRIGPNWDASVWGSLARFESQRSWAGLPANPGPTGLANSVMASEPIDRISEMIELAAKAANDRHWSDATQMAQQAIDTAKPLPGTATQMTRGYVLLASIEYRQGHMLEVQGVMDRAVAAISQKSGPDSIEVAETVQERAMLELALNDDRLAEADLRRAIGIYEKKGPSERLAFELTNLGMVCQRRGRDQEAIELFQRAIKLYDADRPGNLSTMTPLRQLGTLCQKAGRNQEAENAFLRLLQLMEGHFGANHPALADPLSKLANLYSSMGKQAEAKRIQERLQSLQPQATN
jgi:tetratricopeptide (TPR) repeat protein